MSARDDLLRSLKLAVRYAEEGEYYVLADGTKTHWYLDARPITYGTPKMVAFAIMETLQRVPMNRVDVVGGPALGATAMGVAVASLYDIRSFTTRSPLDHGLGGSIVGDLRKGDRVVMLDNVVHSAGSLLRSTKEVALAEGMIVAALCLVYRGKEPMNYMALPGHDHTTESPSVPFMHLFTPEDLEIRDA